MTIETGTAAPDFTLPDQRNQPVRLSDFAGRRDVLLVFFPLAFTAVCEGELCAVRDNLTDFLNDQVQVLTVSVSPAPVHAAWAAQERFEFPILSDFWPHGAVSTAYGVFNEQMGIANRGTFVIDREGIVRFAEMNGPRDARDQAGWRRALAAVYDARLTAQSKR
ncbi:peroxiredoxin [Micromonospora gifhornensis]